MVGNIHIMGIINLTPDSFYAGSRTAAAGFAARAADMLAQGADVLDLGGCSTRPGSTLPSPEEEWSRLEPILLEVAEHRPSGSSIPVPPAISIDTFRAEIVRRAYELIGPFMVNDISAGHLDPAMLETVGRLGLPYIAMHMKGTPETMQQFTDYGDLIGDILAYFREFGLKAQDAGIRDWILDPGFGFSKTIEQNYELLRRLPELRESGREILAGLSRKSMVYKKLGITPEEAMPATQVVQFAALQGGATWLRVHDVAPAVQTARLYSTMYTSSPGAAK